MQSESDNELDIDYEPIINSVSQSFESFSYHSDNEFCELTDNTQSWLKTFIFGCKSIKLLENVLMTYLEF